MYNLNRFIEKQKEYYSEALKEIKDGRKQGHWIWYIFPQIKGLGFSDMSIYYGIESFDEAIEYIKNDYLYNNLKEITEALLNIETNNILNVMEYPDNLKIKSSMTLFYLVSNNELFKKVLDKFFNGELDQVTINILKK